MSKKPVPVGDANVVFEGNILEVVQQPHQIGKETKMFEWARRAPGTRLMIVKDGRMLLSREYRREVGEFDYRLPGGKVFDTLKGYKQALASGNDMLWAAKEGAIREAREEVGIIPNKLELFHLSKNGTTVHWDLYYMEVTDFEDTGTQKLEEGEDITMDWFTFKDVKDIAISGKMNEDRSVGVLLRYLADKA